MKRLFIVSVGTSIILNLNNDDKYKKNPIDVDQLNSDYNDQLPFPGHEKALQDNSKNSYYCRQWDKFKGYLDLDSFSQKEKVAKSSAEMSSILFENKGFKLNQDDKILLIATNTPEGHFSAYALKYLIEKKWGLLGEDENKEGLVTIRTDIEGLGSASDDNFALRGLPNFLSCVQTEIINGLSGAKEVILIPTGGYKALIPYMVIAGILEQVPNHYVYEKSNRVLKLPPLPLHVDIPAWLQIQSVMEVLDGKVDFLNNKVYTSFKKHISGLLVKDSNGKLVRTGLDKSLGQKAQSVGGIPELVLRTQSSPLLEFLGNDLLQQRFLKISKIGHLIWKGDRVPEMADHALRHHNDLFLLAERFLLPIFYFNPNFLSSHELFVLLGALFLHDCGHVVGTIELEGNNRRLLPTEVRDHHHVLGYLRLNEPEGHGKTGLQIYKALKMDNETISEIWDTYLQAIAVIGLYHRKKMMVNSLFKISDSSFQPCYPFFNRDDSFLRCLNFHINALPCKSLKVDSESINFDRAALLVSLLRIIDSLDEQASRTGGPADVAFHLAQLETEAEEERARNHSFKEALLGIESIKSAFLETDKILDKRIYDYICAEGKGYEDKDLKEKVNSERLGPEKFLKEFEKIIKSSAIQPMRSLFEEYIHSRLREFFKKFQNIPYGEKVYIQGIKIKGEKRSGGEIEIMVDIKMNEDISIIEKLINAGCSNPIEKEGQSMNMKDPNGRDSYRKYMLNELEKEYLTEEGLIKTILENNGIKIKYEK